MLLGLHADFADAGDLLGAHHLRVAGVLGDSGRLLVPLRKELLLVSLGAGGGPLGRLVAGLVVPAGNHVVGAVRLGLQVVHQVVLQDLVCLLALRLRDVVARDRTGARGRTLTLAIEDVHLLRGRSADAWNVRRGLRVVVSAARSASCRHALVGSGGGSGLVVETEFVNFFLATNSAGCTVLLLHAEGLINLLSGFDLLRRVCSAHAASRHRRRNPHRASEVALARKFGGAAEACDGKRVLVRHFSHHIADELVGLVTYCVKVARDLVFLGYA